MRIQLFLLTILTLNLGFISKGFGQSNQPLVVIDSGHHDCAYHNHGQKQVLQRGAIGTCGDTEDNYNDRVTAALQNQLSSSYRTLLTRNSGQPVNVTNEEHLRSSLSPGAFARWHKDKLTEKDARSLLARPALANSVKCDAFVSIHHDSIHEDYQEGDPNSCTTDVRGNRNGGSRVIKDLKDLPEVKIGFNVLVNTPNGSNPEKEARDLKLAQFISKRLMRDLKRTPSNYHGKSFLGKSLECPACKDVDPQLGIISKGVAVLGQTTECPAVLIEVGNIVDPEDEKLINTPEFRARFAEAVRAALNDYFKSLKSQRSEAEPTETHALQSATVDMSVARLK